MKRIWLWLVGLLAVILLGGGAYYYWSNTNTVSAEADETEAVQTSTVRVGDITISATGAGTIIPAQELNLSFPSSGVLVEIPVRVGQDVDQGDVLARLDDTIAQEALANAELQLAQALMQTDSSATAVGISFDEINVEQARLDLETAEADLQELVNWEPDPDEVAQVEANLEAAEAGYNAALGQEASNSTNITLAQFDVQDAEQALADAEEAVRIAYDPGREWELYIDDPSCRTGEQNPNCTGEPYSDKIKNERESADNALERAQDNLEKARINYNAAVSSTNRSSSTSAQGSLLSAELALKSAQTGPTAEEIGAAEKAVRQAELALKQAQLNREQNELGLQQSRLDVTAAGEALADTILTAPIDGTILAINGAVGEAAAGGLITMADLEQPLLEIYLDETDLDKVGLDYEVEVVFDAFPDDLFSGHIIQIDPQLSEDQGLTAVRALVLLDEDSFAKPQNLPIGLNATIEVIGGRATDALLVPVEAVREISSGSYAVFVMEDGEPQLRMVEVGLMDFTFAEITSGLQTGEVVTTGLIATE